MSLELEEDIDFSKLYADKRHKELLLAIKQLANVLKHDESKDAAVINAINSGKATFDTLKSAFINKLQELSKPELKAPIVNINQNEVVTSVDKMKEEITRLKEIIDRKEWVFTVERDRYSHRITTVIAKPK